MEIDEPGWPLIDDFFEGLAEGRTAPTVRRYARVRHRLYDFLDDDDMSGWLQPDEVTLLAAEREFGREGALRSIAGIDGLLRCLPGFVAVDRLPPTEAEARMQISVISRFVDYLRGWHLDRREHARSWALAVQAVRRARLDLHARDSPSLQAAIDDIDRIHGRFKQEPGPQW